jgi:hypothetical protein
MQRLRRYFPIFMIALMVQILAPIGASRAFAAAITDPLAAAEICLSGLSSKASDQGGQHRGHDASCVLCCSFNASAANFSAPEPALLAVPYRSPNGVVWRENALVFADACTGSNARARAPPTIS